jgi:hypothetical protein
MAEFVRISGPEVKELGQDIMDRLAIAYAQGIRQDIAAGVALCTAVDFWRANYGDDQTAERLKAIIDRRLSKPLEAWGSHAMEVDRG